MSNRTKSHLYVLLGGIALTLLADFALTSWKEGKIKHEDILTERVSTPDISVVLPNKKWRKEEVRAGDFNFALLSGEGIEIAVNSGSKAKDLNFDESEYVIENKNINGLDVKIVIPRGWGGVTGMTYLKGSRRTTFTAQDLLKNQKEIVLMIFETVR